jgi:hypothetical protein
MTKHDRDPQPDPDAPMAFIRRDLETSSQIRRNRSACRSDRIAANRLGSGSHTRRVACEPLCLPRERELPRHQQDKERRGQGAEKFNGGLPAFAFRSLRSLWSHPWLTSTLDGP